MYMCGLKSLQKKQKTTRRFKRGRSATQRDLVTRQQRGKLKTLNLEPPVLPGIYHTYTAPTNTTTIPKQVTLISFFKSCSLQNWVPFWKDGSASAARANAACYSAVTHCRSTEMGQSVYPCFLPLPLSPLSVHPFFWSSLIHLPASFHHSSPPSVSPSLRFGILPPHFHFTL